jgi:hypothetical protein
MKKKISIGILVTALVLGTIIFVPAFCGSTVADDNSYGPAPNSGDGIPDGSGLDPSDWSSGKGPAPNSGDGIPDGSGF